jgi:hypothetical protein
MLAPSNINKLSKKKLRLDFGHNYSICNFTTLVLELQKVYHIRAKNTHYK